MPNNHMHRSLAFLAALASVVTLIGCAATPPPNQGTSGYRMDPTADSQSEYHVQSLRSPDLIAATDQAAMDIARRLDIVDPSNPPVIVVGQIENRTTAMPHANWQIFPVRLRALLMESAGPRHGLRFVRERTFIERERDREYAGRDAASTATRYQSDADYVLTCEVYDLPSGGTNFFLLDFQLVQLRAAQSGPDVGPGTIIWSKSYEAKFN